MNRHRQLIFFLLLAAIAIWWRVGAAAQPASPLIAFLDVGQGDATYIRHPSGADILVDGGPGDRVVGELGRLMPFFDRELSLVVLTHPHRDHLEGLIPVIEQLTVRELWLTGVKATTELDDRLIARARGQGVEINFVRAGETEIFGADQKNTMALRVLHPELSLKDESAADLNATSLILRLSLGDQCLILPGDAETEVLNDEVQEDRGVLDCEILKASHHGSRNGTTRAWLEAVRPNYSVISAGEGNRFGHPHPETLRLLGESRAIIYRTDEQGTIVFTLSGDGKWEIRTFDKSPFSRPVQSSAQAED